MEVPNLATMGDATPLWKTRGDQSPSGGWSPIVPTPCSYLWLEDEPLTASPHLTAADWLCDTLADMWQCQNLFPVRISWHLQLYHARGP